MSGLAAMRPLTTRTSGGIALEISRPLLGVWREEIDAYVRVHRLKFREDASNADLHPTRNRLRHELLPAIERTLGREVRAAVWRTAEILRADDELLVELGRANEPGADPSALALRAQPLALQRRLLHAWLRAKGVPGVGYEHVEAVRALLAGRGAKCNLPGGWHARRRDQRLFLEPPRRAGLCD